jgi:MFS superfamily sulfate permease-like transporter
MSQSAAASQSPPRILDRLFGLSESGSNPELVAGVGGRTGLTALFVAVFVLAALFFAPLAGMVPAYASAAGAPLCRQRLADRQKIAPGEPLLQRLAQQIGGV